MSSIQKRENGKWRARYRDAAGKEHARHFDRKVDGQRWLDTVTAAVVTGAYVDPNAGRLTLRSYFEEWSARQLWESGTRRAMELSMRSCSFADIELKRIRRSDVETWVKLLATTLAANTVHARVQNVRSVLRAAVRDKVIASDPSAGVVLPRRRRVEHAMRIPAPDTVGALYEASDEWFKTFIALCAFAGLRLGEAAGVRRSDIDFLRRALKVERQVHRQPGHELEIRPPKYGSERTVHLPDGLLNVLSDHIREVGVYGLEEWLFPGMDGAPMLPRKHAYTWDRLCMKIGVEGVTIHDLRHYYASGLIASGCDVVTVQRALGHKTATVTLNTYSHLWPSADDRTRAGAQFLMDQSFGFPADRVRTGE
ncbi:tyrosine-type recombinase/integrase [Agromyces sp. NPDC056965]|uniref:tyrosine-type recombinase/integrase n=1 Tax=Agromyces sp. NPDC056965 TaxID=3345983 RepID=UPI00362D5D8C